MQKRLSLGAVRNERNPANWQGVPLNMTFLPSCRNSAAFRKHWPIVLWTYLDLRKGPICSVPMTKECSTANPLKRAPKMAVFSSPKARQISEKAPPDELDFTTSLSRDIAATACCSISGAISCFLVITGQTESHKPHSKQVLSMSGYRKPSSIGSIETEP